MLHDPKRKPHYDRPSLLAMVSRLLVVCGVIAGIYIYSEAMKYAEPKPSGILAGSRGR
jgi:hypothetical protein